MFITDKVILLNKMYHYISAAVPCLQTNALSPCKHVRIIVRGAGAYSRYPLQKVRTPYAATRRGLGLP
jgi:hypothetical protein